MEPTQGLRNDLNDSRNRPDQQECEKVRADGGDTVTNRTAIPHRITKGNQMTHKPSPADLAPKAQPVDPSRAIADALATEIRRRDDRIRDLEIENRTLRSVLGLAFRGIVSSRLVGEFHE